MSRTDDFAATLARHRVIVLPWFKPDRWQRLLELSADRDALPPTHAEFEHLSDEALSVLASSGFKIELVTLDPDEVAQWCRDFGTPLDARARERCALLRLLELECKLAGCTGRA